MIRDTILFNEFGFGMDKEGRAKDCRPFINYPINGKLMLSPTWLPCSSIKNVILFQ